MDKFSIAIIKPNKFNINDIKFKNTPNFSSIEINDKNNMMIKNKYVDFEHFNELVKDYVIIERDVTNETLMKKVVNHIEMDIKWTADNRDSYTNRHNLFNIA